MAVSPSDVQSQRRLTLPLPLVLLLAGDLAFVILHVFHKTVRRIGNYLVEIDIVGGYATMSQYINTDFLHHLTLYFVNPLFNIEMDNGYAENYQHLKFAGIIFVLCYLCIKNEIWSFLPWALLFTYFLFDDALRLHERLGFMIAEGTSVMPLLGLRKQDVGELIVIISAGLIILPSLLIAYYYASPTLRRLFHHLVVILSLLIFFGVGIDMVHVVFRASQTVSQILGIIEDGGEMLAVSIFAWYVFSLTKRSLNLKRAVSQPTYGLPDSVMANVRY